MVLKNFSLREALKPLSVSGLGKSPEFVDSTAFLSWKVNQGMENQCYSTQEMRQCQVKTDPFVDIEKHFPKIKSNDDCDDFSFLHLHGKHHTLGKHKNIA